MNHSFSSEVASTLGIEKALLLKELSFTIDYKRRNKLNFHDDSYWAYYSSAAFHKKFSYLTVPSISRWLIQLEEEGYIITTEGEDKFDRTKWYSLTDKYYQLTGETQYLSTSQNEQSDSQIENSYKDTTNTNTTNTNTEKESKKEKVENPIISKTKEFYSSEHKKAHLHEQESNYVKFVQYLFTLNPLKEPQIHILKIPRQVTFAEFCSLMADVGINGLPLILGKLEVMVNTPKYTKGKQSLYLTLKNWLKP